MSELRKTSSSISIGDFDPLLKDLADKKLNFRRNVASLLSELEEARAQLTLHKSLLLKETDNRKVAQMKVKEMEVEMFQLKKSLEERNEELQASALIIEQHLNELNKLKSRLPLTQATVDATVTSTQHVLVQCLNLLRELNQKCISLERHGDQVDRLEERLNLLQIELREKEANQKELKDEVTRIEHELMGELRNAGATRDCELGKILGKVSTRNFERINKHRLALDEEMARLKHEIKGMSERWMPKAKELELQLERHQASELELKKRLVKLEYCFQQTHFHMWQLRRMGETGDKTLVELADQLEKIQHVGRYPCKQRFWESPSFKITISMSLLVLFIYARL